ncbi:MAG: PqqD family protein [Acidobacteriota bacterium]
MTKFSSSPVNLLDLIPERKTKWENKEGQIILLKNKFKNPLLVKHLLPRMKNPYYRIKLDRIGSEVWGLCDGKKTVHEIGECLQQRFQEKIDPVYDRLALFLQTLERNHFILFKKNKNTS